MLDFVMEKILFPVACIVGGTGLLVLIALIAWAPLGIYHYNTCPRIEKQIVEIGGCNRYECGVKYDDGTTGNESSPVLGELVSMCR